MVFHIKDNLTIRQGKSTPFLFEGLQKLNVFAIFSTMNDIEFLISLMTPQRLSRIDTVLAQRTRDVCVVLLNIDKPHNFMAVMRTCDCFGIQDIHIVLMPDQKPSDISQAVTQGAHKWLTIHTYRDWKECFARLKESGYRLLASYLDEKQGKLDDLELKGKLALVFGNELKGLSDEEVAACDDVFMIPMKGFSQSFNISVACALAIQRVFILRELRKIKTSFLDDLEKKTMRDEWIRKAVPRSRRVLSAAKSRQKENK